MKNSSNIVAIILAVALFYSFTSPEYRKMRELRASAAEYASVIENISRIAASRDALLVKYEDIPRVERERLQKILPSNIDSVRLAFDLNNIASRYGVALKNLQVEKADPNSSLAVLPGSSASYEKVTVTFGFVSNYENFVKFLYDLEKSLRIMDVKEVDFRVVEGGYYDHEIKVETYWLK